MAMHRFSFIIRLQYDCMKYTIGIYRGATSRAGRGRVINLNFFFKGYELCLLKLFLIKTLQSFLSESPNKMLLSEDITMILSDR